MHRRRVDKRDLPVGLTLAHKRDLPVGLTLAHALALLLTPSPFRFTANDSFSYDVVISAKIEGTEPAIETENTVYLQDQHYHYLYNEQSAVDAQGQGHVKGNSSQA